MFESSDYIEKAKMIYALEFDAYRYLENVNLKLSEITQPIEA
jgi:hypothetical protein